MKAAGCRYDTETYELMVEAEAVGRNIPAMMEAFTAMEASGELYSLVPAPCFSCPEIVPRSRPVFLCVEELDSDENLSLRRRGTLSRE